MSFYLPGYLENVTGARIPLVFSATDGLLIVKNRANRFNPAQTLSVKLNPSDNEAEIYLGGTASPAPGQVAGRYSATITVVIVPNGI